MISNTAIDFSYIMYLEGYQDAGDNFPTIIRITSSKTSASNMALMVLFEAES